MRSAHEDRATSRMVVRGAAVLFPVERPRPHRNRLEDALRIAAWPCVRPESDTFRSICFVQAGREKGDFGHIEA